MNGSANGFAGALFFSLVAIGVILATGDIIGWGIGAVSALFAAVSLRSAFIQAAEAAEEDHQRIEIQFQQLRQKVGENSPSGSMATVNRSISEISETVQDNLHGMRSRLSALDNLQIIAETNAAIGAALKNIEDNTKLTEKSLHNVAEKISETSGEIQKVSKSLTKNLETLCTLGENNKATLQTGIKLMQVFGQILKNPAFAKDLEKISASTEKIIEKTNLLDDVNQNLSDSKSEISALVKMLEEISEKNLNVENSTVDAAEKFSEVGEKIISTNENLTEMLDGMRKEVSALTKKIEAYNGLTKATLDQYSNLTEQDIRVLEKIAEKVNG
ncbi:MAG: hypothetical protein IJU55_00755 [Selenomonadaceae bacterium]|nr:hypothetical protein [Selenomonadaceae bacterium]